MIKKILTSLSLFIFLAVVFSACKKKSQQATLGQLEIAFEHVWGSSAAPFALNSTLVHPKTGDSLTFTLFRYYVSNIQLKHEDGTWWSAPDSYYIIDEQSAATKRIQLSNVPSGHYTEMKYTMGVDSLRNVSGAQDGALSVSEGMFWNWNSGYIMLKAEGTAPNAASNSFLFHLGGFSGANNIVSLKSTNFGGTHLVIEGGKTPAVHLTANPARLWHSSPSVSVKNVIHMPGAEAKIMAEDFYSNISFNRLDQ
jgi:hypothetical protein